MDIEKCVELADSIPRLVHKVELAWLVEQAGRAPIELQVVNLGVWLGASVAALALGRADAIKAGARRVIAVDHFEGSAEHVEDTPILENNLFQQFNGHMQRLGISHLIETIATTTTAASQSWNAGPIGLLFVDASHDELSVRKDFDAWVPWVAPGGVVSFHDYGSVGWPGVRAGVDASNQDRVGNIQIVGSMWTGVKIK